MKEFEELSKKIVDFRDKETGNNFITLKVNEEKYPVDKFKGSDKNEG